MLVSNASVQKPGQSNFAWVIANNATPLWWDMGLMPGPAEDMYSRRAEAFGLLTSAMFLAYYLSCYNQSIPLTTFNCFATIWES